jgi:hypothetical protein
MILGIRNESLILSLAEEAVAGGKEQRQALKHLLGFFAKERFCRQQHKVDEQLRTVLLGVPNQVQPQVTIAYIQQCLWPAPSDSSKLAEQEQLDLEPTNHKYHLHGR